MDGVASNQTAAPAAPPPPSLPQCLSQCNGKPCSSFLSLGVTCDLLQNSLHCECEGCEECICDECGRKCRHIKGLNYGCELHPVV